MCWCWCRTFLCEDCWMVGAPSKSQCALDRIKLEKHNDFCESRNTKSKRGCYEWYAHSLVPATSVIYERLGRDDISYWVHTIHRYATTYIYADGSTIYSFNSRVASGGWMWRSLLQDTMLHTTETERYSISACVLNTIFYNINLTHLCRWLKKN